MLKLSKAQYKQLCSDCAAEMMRGVGHGGKIPDFSGTDMDRFHAHPHSPGERFTSKMISLMILWTGLNIHEFIISRSRVRGSVSRFHLRLHCEKVC